MNWLSDPGVGLTAALTLAVILVCAAIGKLLAFDEFAGVVANYQILPEWPNLNVSAARAIPVLEIMGGFGLLVPATRLPAAMLVLLLLITFTVALVVNLARGRTRIHCGCFGRKAPRRISWVLVARNCLLIAADGLVVTWGSDRGMTALDCVTAVGAALALAMLYSVTPLLSRIPFDDWHGGCLPHMEAGDD